MYWAGLVMLLSAPVAALPDEVEREALARYRAGDFETAARLWSRDDDGDAHYNRGNALARAGRLQDALGAYSLALQHRPDDGDARHNQTVVERLLRSPPPPPSSPPRGQGGGAPQPAQREADRLADSWLRKVPDGVPPDARGWLARRLAAEQQRRDAGAQ